MSRGWEIMDEPAAESCCCGYNSAFEQNIRIKIHTVSQIIVLKKETVQNLEPLHSDSAFSGPSLLQLFFLHCWLLSQLETTFGGTMSEHKPLLKFIFFFRFLHSSQIPVISPVNLHSFISLRLYLYRAIATHLITVCSIQKHGFDSRKSAKLA